MDIKSYREGLNALNKSYEKQQNRVESFEKSLHIFADKTEIKWTSEQKTKAIEEAKEDVLELESIVINLKKALDMPLKAV